MGILFSQAGKNIFLGRALGFAASLVEELFFSAWGRGLLSQRHVKRQACLPLQINRKADIL
jgi:hypothetical protein